MLHRARVSIWRLLFLLLQLPTVSRQSPPLMPCQFTSVWTASHHRVCLSTASRSPVQLIRGGICVPPTVMPYRVSGSTLTAVGRSQLLARWPGTHFRISSGIQRAAQTLLGVYLKRTCSRVISASSASGVLTIMRCTNPRTRSPIHGCKNVVYIFKKNSCHVFRCLTYSFFIFSTFFVIKNVGKNVTEDNILMTFCIICYVI